MKVRDLIAQLNNLYLDSEIYVWVDGERLEVDSVDASFNEDGYGDINVKYERVLVNSDGQVIGEAP